MSTYHSIIVATNLDDHTTKLLKKATELVHDVKGTLHLVHVNKPIGFAFDRALTLGTIESSMGDLEAQALQHVKDQLEELASPLEGISVRCHALLGQPVAELDRLAKEQKASLVICGQHKKHHWGLSNTSLSLMYGASGYDILIVTD